jgi:UDP-N-acetylmuramate dehydrogenase
MRFADLTTLRVGGEIADYRRAESEREIIEVITACDAAGRPLVIVAGGSNIVAADRVFDDTTVLHITSSGTSLTRDACSGGMIAVAAGHPWDDFVASVNEFGFSGVECLSGIPGSVGATPIQNVGAYGQQVSDTIARVRVFDRSDRAVRTIAVADCGFGYRSSMFKRQSQRFVVLEVTFQLKNATMSEPIRYAELASHLGVEIGERVPLADARAAVLELRRRKGMVLDADDRDTWSAGSFFLNPVLTAAEAERLPADAPRWPQADGSIKVPAAWLIEAAGFVRGHGRDGAGISTKHPLALTNRGSATADALIALARDVREGVRAKFGVVLEPEVRLVGVAL